MERSQEYEPLILDLQKSQSVQQPKRLVLMSLMAIAVVSLLAATTFAVLYFTRPPTQGPVPIPRDLPTATPAPETTPEVVIPDIPPETVIEPTPLPAATATPQPVATTPPAPATGFLTLYSSPDNAEVVVDGTLLGRTPLQKYELPVGTYTVQFAHEGKVSKYTITIKDGETAEYIHQFQGFASVRIRTIPSDSNVYVNGEPAGHGSPVELGGLLSGTYTISVRKSGYASAEKTVVLEKEGHQDVFITLRRRGPGIDDSDSSSATPVPEHPSDRLEGGN